MREPSAAIVALRELVNILAHKAAADRHGTPEQAAESQKCVDHVISKAWSVLHEYDYTSAAPPDNYQQTQAWNNNWRKDKGIPV